MALSTRRMESSFPIRNIQIALQALSEQYPNMIPPIPDGVYGPVTIAAVAEFQRNHQLPASGETDRATWDAIHAAYFELLHQRRTPEPMHIFPAADAVLIRASEDDAIYAVQLMLRRIAHHFSDFIPIEITGVLDSDTDRELRRFQARAMLPETGQIDRETWDRLVRLHGMLAEFTAGESAPTPPSAL